MCGYRLEKPRLYMLVYECPSCHRTLHLEFESRLGVYICPKCGFKAEILIKLPAKH